LTANATVRHPDPWRRNQLIVDFLGSARTSLSAENGV
jgi:hypothetical protein